MKIKIEIQNLKFTTNEKPHLNRKYQIKIKIYTFGILPIINIKLNNKKIQKILNNKKIKEKIKQRETKIIENKSNIDKELITSLKNIQTEIKEINLKILIGTENASLTAFIIPAISTFIAMFLSKQIPSGFYELILLRGSIDHYFPIAQLMLLVGIIFLVYLCVYNIPLLIVLKAHQNEEIRKEDD